MSTIGGSNPEYVNARVRARRAALFDDEDYRKLVRMGPSGIARFMEESEYEVEINELGARYSGVDLIEFALNRNLAKHFHDLLAWSGGRLHELIARYLRKYDAWNLKTVIRAVYTDATFEEIEADLILAGELELSLFERMVRADTVAEAIDHLSGTIYHEPLQEALEEYEEEAVLVPLENAIDREFYTRLLADIDTDNPPRTGPMAMYVEFLQAEVDFLNIRNALRIARSGADIPPDAFAIDGGQLFTRDDLVRLVGDLDALVTEIRESSYGDELGGALDDLETANGLIDFERALDGILLTYTGRLANVYPVSITSILSYILAKEREVENIRAIARGKEAGLPADEIEQELVIT